MGVFTDQLGNGILISGPPRRIVSIVPSQTELLHDLALDSEVIGITKFCIHPDEWFRSKTRVGGTKTLNIEKIKELAPDLIIGNKEENIKDQVEALREVAPVWVSDVNNLRDAIQMIQAIGEITNRSDRAKQIISEVSTEFEKVSSAIPGLASYKTAYLIWKNPYMSIGGDTFIHDMLSRCGLLSVVREKNRYPEVTLEELKALGCNLVLLSSEPYPFREKDIGEIKAALPDATVLLVDGEMFSWYGSRLQKAPAYFNDLLSGL